MARQLDHVQSSFHLFLYDTSMTQMLRGHLAVVEGQGKTLSGYLC